MSQQEDVAQLTVRLPRDLHKRLKIVQVRDGRPMNEVVVGMITSWVSKKEAEQDE